MYLKNPETSPNLLMKKNIKSFTIMEVLIVVVIVGILSTLSMTQYSAYRENVFNKEAQANLRMILAAERVARMESNNNQYVGCADSAAIRTNLRVDLVRANPIWNYSVTINAAGDNLCAQATRNGGDARSWSIWAPNLGTPDPQPMSGVCGVVN